MRATIQRPRHRRWCRLLLAGTSSLVTLAGCGGDETTGPALRDPQTLAWSMQVDHPAILLSTVAPHNTQQLAVTVRTLSGAPLDVPATVQYSIEGQDTSVAVSAAGLVTAQSSTFGNAVRVNVAATSGGVTFRTFALVVVTDDPAPLRLATFSIQPDPGFPSTLDCASPYSGVFAPSPVLRALDANGTPIAGATVFYRSSRPDILPVDSTSGYIDPTLGCRHSQFGPVTIYGTTTVYGVSKTDSIRFKVIPALFNTITVRQSIPAATGVPVSYFDPGTITVSPGAVVVWRSLRTATTQPVDVVFDDPSKVQVVDTAVFFGIIPANPPEPNGNIAAFVPDEAPESIIYRTRRFTIPGTYHYHSSLYGTSGTIIVQDTTAL